jgi:hypothetical protein
VPVNPRSDQIAGFLSLLAALLAGVNWYVYRFVADPALRPLADSGLGRLAYSFTPETADRWWFIWLGTLPFALAVVGAAYLSRFARTQAVAMLLLTVLVILAGATLYAVNWALAVVVALPIFWGWRCVRGG